MISVNQASAMCGISRHGILTRINRGTLPAVKDGYRWWIEEDIVNRLISNEPLNPIQSRLTHGLSNTGTHRSWSMMKTRCYNPNSGSYRHYGGRGIKVCKRWLDNFENFLQDMGERPPGTTLDRYPDGDGDYTPGNCRWATAEQQMKNRRKWGKKNVRK